MEGNPSDCVPSVSHSVGATGEADACEVRGAGRDDAGADETAPALAFGLSDVGSSWEDEQA